MEQVDTTSARGFHVESSSSFINQVLLMQYVPSTISRQLEFGKTIRVSSMKESVCRQDFQQWSQKAEAFLARVIKESEMMLERLAEQATDIKLQPSLLNSCEEFATWGSCCSCVRIK